MFIVVIIIAARYRPRRRYFKLKQVDEMLANKSQKKNYTFIINYFIFIPCDGKFAFFPKLRVPGYSLCKWSKIF